MYQNQNLSSQINQCQNIIQQLMNQTQQTSQMYQQMLQQEQQNATRLEELAQREQKSTQTIQNALHGHQLAMQQMQQLTQICKQLEQSVLSNNNIQAFNQQQQQYNPNSFNPTFKSFQ
jgi:hypothetical protein